MNKRIENDINSQDEDFNLIKAFLANDGNAFNRLVLKYRDIVFNLCFRLLGDYDEANDAAQEVFLNVYKKLDGFKFQSGFSTWLYRITVNMCKNNLSSLRTRMRKKTFSLSNGTDSFPSGENKGEYKVNYADNSTNPARVYEMKEKNIAIQNAIDSLAGKEKIVVVLRDIEGRSYEEIGEITGLKQGTVKSTLARARQQLREKLRGIF